MENDLWACQQNAKQLQILPIRFMRQNVWLDVNLKTRRWKKTCKCAKKRNKKLNLSVKNDEKIVKNCTAYFNRPFFLNWWSSFVEQLLINNDFLTLNIFHHTFFTFKKTTKILYFSYVFHVFCIFSKKKKQTLFL